MTPSDNDSQPAAIRALGLFPQAVWPVDELDPLVRAIVELVRDTPADQRTEPSTVDALQLADALSAALPDAVKLPIRRDLRAMGVQVVTIDTLPEQMRFDVKWFPVEAGRPIQIVFHNADAMPHNLVIGRPKSVSEIGNAAAALTLPSDPAAKAYIPNSPLVLNSTRLAADGDTLRLNFVAPKEPGEYVYLCTFPGHWVRDVRRHACGRGYGGVGSPSDGADRPGDQSAVYVEKELRLRLEAWGLGGVEAWSMRLRLRVDRTCSHFTSHRTSHLDSRHASARASSDHMPDRHADFERGLLQHREVLA